MSEEIKHNLVYCSLSGKELVDIIYKHTNKDDRAAAQLISLSIADIYEPISYHFISSNEEYKIENIPIIIIEEDEVELSNIIEGIFEDLYYPDFVEANIGNIVDEIISDLKTLQVERQNNNNKITKQSVIINKDILKVIIKSELHLQLPPPFESNVEEEIEKSIRIADKIIEKIESYDYDNLTSHFDIKDYKKDGDIYKNNTTVGFGWPDYNNNDAHYNLDKHD